MRTSGDHPNNSIIKIGQNTEKSPRDLRTLVVTQTPVKVNSSEKPSANHIYQPLRSDRI